MPATGAKKLGKFAKMEGRVTAASLSTDLRVYATKRWPLDKDERRKERLATLLNMTKRRVRSLWENEQSARPRGEEIDRIKALISVEETIIEEANRDAFAALQERIARLEAIVLAYEAAQDNQSMAGEGQGTQRRRRTDGPWASRTEHHDQSQGWGR